MKITKMFVDKLTPPEKGQVFYRDDQLKGFGIRVTPGNVKSFIIEKRVRGQVKRFTVGRYPELTVEMARKEAQKVLGKIATGIDPVAESKESRVKGVTLAKAFDDYIKARKSLKPGTETDYRRALNQVVPDWWNKPLLSITKEMIGLRHMKHGTERSQARSNLAMRILRAIFNFAAGEYEDAKGQSLILENPTKRLSHTRAWYRIERRQSIIKKHDLKAWYEGLMQLSHRYDADKAEMMKDYFLLVLFTGLRREEATSVKWSDIDLRAKTMTITDTKNSERHTIPLSNFLEELLLHRKKATGDSLYVFPADSATGHL